MTPANIVGMSLLKELDIIAITDHNSCKNCPALMELAQENHLIAIPGMELCTMEEVHVLCYFSTLKDAMLFDSYVSSKLLPILNKESIFGKQQIYNANDQLVGEEPYLLINATEISFDHLSALMKEYHGIYIPAHVDKNSNSLLSNLGFVPPNADFSCVEIKNPMNTPSMLEKHPYFQNCKIIYDSDSHGLGQIQEPVNFLKVNERSTNGVLSALKNSNY